MDIYRQAIVNDRNIFPKRRKAHKPGIIGGIFLGYIGNGFALIGKHILAYCVTLGIVPAHKHIVLASSGGGADGLFRSIHIFVSVKNADGIVGNILPCTAVPYLTNVLLPDSAVKPCIIGFYAFFCFQIFVSGVRGEENHLSVFVLRIPTDEFIAGIGNRGHRDPLIGCGVIGFAAVFGIRTVVIFVSFLHCDLHMAASVGIIETELYIIAGLGDKCLKPAPLRHQGHALVHIGVEKFFALILPEDAVDGHIVTAVLDVLCQLDFPIQELEILRRIQARSIIEGIVAGHGVHSRNDQISQLVRIYSRNVCILRNINEVAGDLPAHELPAVVLTLCRVGNIGWTENILVTLALVIDRLEVVNIGILLIVELLSDNVRFTAVGVVGDHGALEKHKVQIRCRGDGINLVGINYIAVFVG